MHTHKLLCALTMSSSRCMSANMPWKMSYRRSCRPHTATSSVRPRWKGARILISCCRRSLTACNNCCCNSCCRRQQQLLQAVSDKLTFLMTWNVERDPCACPRHQAWNSFLYAWESYRKSVPASRRTAGSPAITAMIKVVFPFQFLPLMSSAFP